MTALCIPSVTPSVHRERRPSNKNPKPQSYADCHPREYSLTRVKCGGGYRVIRKSKTK